MPANPVGRPRSSTSSVPNASSQHRNGNYDPIEKVGSRDPARSAERCHLQRALFTAWEPAWRHGAGAGQPAWRRFPAAAAGARSPWLGSSGAGQEHPAGGGQWPVASPSWSRALAGAARARLPGGAQRSGPGSSTLWQDHALIEEAHGAAEPQWRHGWRLGLPKALANLLQPLETEANGGGPAER